MSGHSKWANIKHRKSKTDAARGKLFARLSREIIMAAKQGGGDPDGNPRLRLAIDRARAENMPNDNIARAIARATGGGEGSQLEEMICEGYGPSGVAILVEAVTDNRNRTLPEIRALFSKHGGSLGEAGCVAWMFSEKGLLRVPGTASQEEQLTDLAVACDAEDISEQDGVFDIVVPQASLDRLRTQVMEAGFQVLSAEAIKSAQNYISLSEEQAKPILQLVTLLEEHDDVQNVHANFEILDGP